ncbi:hypothetical protein [Ammoniphilus sp. 3BR4]
MDCSRTKTFSTEELDEMMMFCKELDLDSEEILLLLEANGMKKIKGGF